MNHFLDILLNWWVLQPGAIIVQGSGESIFIEPVQWREISIISATATVVAVALGVLLCYLPTRRLGQAFLRRWWLFAGLTALASGTAVFVYLMQAGFMYNEAPYSIPFTIAVSRAVVGFLQGGLYFYLASAVGCMLLGKLLGIQAFVNNQQIPVPHLM
jgi:hypothetical protein